MRGMSMRAGAVLAMGDIKTQVIRSLSELISPPLAVARDAADMKNFQFGALRPHPSGRGTLGEYALHIQCPWRLTQSGHIVTGSEDYYEPEETDKEVDLEDWRATFSASDWVRSFNPSIARPGPGSTAPTSWLSRALRPMISVVSS